MQKSGKQFNKLNNLKILFFIIYILIYTMVSAQDDLPLYDDFKPEKISLFTCSLIKSGEYYRAYVELLRLNSFYPSFLPDDVFDITSNYLFYKSKKYNDLLDFDMTRISDNIFIPASLFRIDSLISLNRRKMPDVN